MVPITDLTRFDRIYVRVVRGKCGDIIICDTFYIQCAYFSPQFSSLYSNPNSKARQSKNHVNLENVPKNGPQNFLTSKIKAK